ncbi:bifunctional phosphoribosyl-AMP cyclohydrolase/phosphoribosyl-ATP diphosphatase HisIE [Chryseobacterium geocarposphaerae]|uniref:Histidine biosynthesis bifunctional protein HisIE n=1 Tax=Chryseobacterium geocarposphaerae TaxID=1416776 RepID=A0A2M9C7W4_9FLAO|nr:bifunctional phosphoribosyl-AMP cyclohydrolase/phosphoribosyl-ATP diphosphatase HisIE [Chryseobacterium geocarposphaerae]PJJ66876.1 phosphoribosyl-ATP pyrophosphatase /phosphoribosyl-AMP cyclohydrolase [Chryseobacterium geocarposphaerae]
MNINFNKGGGLVPVIIQDDRTLQVLMLGYMNEEAFEKTKNEGIVTFFSRSKNKLWTKGEESGNFLTVKSIDIDCDQDTILIKTVPKNIVCHSGSFSCFGNKSYKGFLYELEEKINQRIDEEIEDSYTYSLFQKGINKMAQKVGEEAVELVIEAKDNNDYLFKNEAADLLYHYLILLKAKNMSLENIEEILLERNK